jgi:hypothetical protein
LCLEGHSKIVLHVIIYYLYSQNLSRWYLAVFQFIINHILLHPNSSAGPYSEAGPNLLISPSHLECTPIVHFTSLRLISLKAIRFPYPQILLILTILASFKFWSFTFYWSSFRFG